MQCDCDECRKRWVADLISYALALESEVLAAYEAAKAGRMAAAYGSLYALHEIVMERDLASEIAAETQAWNERTAAELREANRLH